MLATALTTEEKIRFSHLEQDIERGKEATLKMAEALAEIKEQKYYREHYKTIEEYCQKRWGFGDRYGRFLLDFARNVADLKSGTMVPILPENERQQRSLTQLETPAQKQEAMRLAAAIAPNSNKPTGAHIEQAVKAVKKGNTLNHGQIVSVVDRDSPMYGQEVTVQNVNGVIVEAATADGQVLPFLTTELTEETLEKPVQKAAPKPSPIEAIAAELELVKERCRVLEEKLGEGIDLLEQYALLSGDRAELSEIRNDSDSWISTAKNLLS